MIFDCDSLSFRALSIDLYKHKNGLFKVKKRPHAAISYRLSGEGDFLIDSKMIRVMQGDILFIPSDMPYEVEYSVSESIVIHLLDCSYGIPEVYRPQNPVYFESVFTRLLDSFDGYSQNRMKTEIYRLFSEMEEDRESGGISEALSSAIILAEREYSDPTLDVEAMCRAAFTSRSGLQREFARRFGTSPGQYLTDLRLERAMELLFKGELSVREVAMKTGFSDEKYFSRAFKAHFGVTPGKIKGGGY